MRNRLIAAGIGLLVAGTLTGAWLSVGTAADLPLPASAGTRQAWSGPFLWGVSTAGFQSEGGDMHSNWAHWYPDDPGIERPGRAADFWNRYDEDMALAKSLGVNAFRLSVEWSRLEPIKGRWDETAIAHYREMFKALDRHGLNPVLTLSHWTMPQWVDAEGGWTNDEVPERYARFVEKVVTEIAPNCRVWLTFNEPNVWLFRDYVLGIFPPNRTNPLAFWSARRNVLSGHALAYDLIHRHIPEAKVSANMYHVELMPESQLATPFGPDAWDNFAYVDLFRSALKPGETAPPPGGRLDYVAYDYYYAFRTVDDLINLKEPWLLPIAPDRLEKVILDYDRRYGLPQLIAENGLATEAGKPRADGWTPSQALTATVQAMGRAMAKGAPMMGYCYWTLTDNYEWGTYVPRFGLFAIDIRHDRHLRRVPTDTAETYRRIIQQQEHLAKSAN